MNTKQRYAHPTPVPSEEGGLPSNSPYMLLRKKRLSISIRFRLRPPSPGRPYPNPCSLQARLSISGQQDSGFAIRLKVNPDLWDQSNQTVKGRSDSAQEANRILTKVKADIERIERSQRDAFEVFAGPCPTCESIKLAYAEFLASGKENERVGGKNIPIRQAIYAYAKHLRSNKETDEGRDEKTIRAYERNVQFLTDYLTANNLNEPSISLITPFWVRQFRQYLSKRPGIRRQKSTMGTASCNLVCRQLAKAVQHFVNNGTITINPLSSLELPVAKTKPVYFLEAVHIERLWSLKPEPRSESALWWMKLMCLTGLDYPDAIRYAANRADCETTGMGGRKIIIRRGKKPHNECHIPVLDRLNDLFAEGVKQPITRGTIKYHFGKIQKLVEFAPVLCPKVCRKTAGAIFINEGYSVLAVSNILGHSRTTVTERHYIRITGHTVDREQAAKTQNK